MSWSLFQTQCSVLTGPQHISVIQFAQTISSAYHSCISLHFETVTGGGLVINNAPKLPVLNQQILAQCNANLHSNSQSINLIQQIGPAFLSYWTGIIITGPTGIVNVLSPGTWNAIPVVQNNNFNIWLNAFMMTARTHIMTLTGQYISSVVPGVTTPWSGATLIGLP